MEMEFEKIQGHELLPVAGRLTRKERLLLTKLQEKQRIEALSSREEAGAQSPAASGLGLLDCEPSVAGVPESNPTLQGLPLKETRSQPLPDTQPKDQVIQQSYYPPPPTWDQVRNSVLNASIASGRFEDLLIVFSPECPTHHGRVSLPSRKLYANRTLVGHALPRADFRASL
ncbi:hypothetical protein C8Q78DRAFT_517326 [Trametes maxima]|nr:hypothetical protein C8Q78DRAFT_517326 [Trametes maxima]